MSHRITSHLSLSPTHPTWDRCPDASMACRPRIQSTEKKFFLKVPGASLPNREKQSPPSPWWTARNWWIGALTSSFLAGDAKPETSNHIFFRIFGDDSKSQLENVLTAEIPTLGLPSSLTCSWVETWDHLQQWPAPPASPKTSAVKGGNAKDGTTNTTYDSYDYNIYCIHRSLFLSCDLSWNFTKDTTGSEHPFRLVDVLGTGEEACLLEPCSFFFQIPLGSTAEGSTDRHRFPHRTSTWLL